MSLSLIRLLEGFAADAHGHEPLPQAARTELLGLIEPSWTQGAVCASVDPDAWFPETSISRADPTVGRVCAPCPVWLSGLATAIVDDEHGIWGGTRRGQRLHARARLLGGDPARDVLAELLAMPLPGTEYEIPEPLADVLAVPVLPDAGAEIVPWRESA